MVSEECSISWNEHPTHVVEVFGRFWEEGALVDCTIAAEGKHLKAHRLMLSACSTYFELVFGREMMKEKVVVIEDIKFKDLKSLIAFMYKGEVTIPKERLREFLRAAEFLQIRGLPNNLVQNSLREATETSVGCAKEGLALQLSYEDSERPASSVESSDSQCVASVSRNETSSERHPTYMQMNLLEENEFSQAQSLLHSDPNRETALFPPHKVPCVEPKEEVEVEDTTIWESEDEITSAETDFSSATAGEGVENELTSVPGTTCSSNSIGSSPQILENESVTFIAKWSSVPVTIPSSRNTASPSPLVPNVATQQSGCAMEDCSLSVHSESADQSTCVKTEPVVKTEVMPAVVSLHRESVVEPMHEVWVEELRSWGSEEVIAETDFANTCNQKTTIQDLGAVGAHGNIQSAVRSKDICKDFPSSLAVAVIEKKYFNAQEVKEETEVGEWCTGQECESVDVESRGDSELLSTVQVHNDNLLNGEREMKGQEIKVETLETALEGDVAVERSDAQEDSAPLLERVSKTLGQKLRRCPSVFYTVGELQLHVKNVHEKIHSKCCGVCLATFASKRDLMRHMSVHTGECPFKCEVCEKSFNHSSALSKHKLIHTGERPFKCDMCEKSFRHSTHLTNHKRIHNGERPFQCDVCQKSFNQSRNLSKHKRIHTGERSFHCDFCERSFFEKSVLTAHMRTHTGERPFYCDVCERSFCLKTTLKRHMRLHTGERPFQCNVCKRSYTDRSGLNSHMRKHTGKHPFDCDVCERSFLDMRTLNRHMHTHTGVRPFHCDVCERSFLDKRTLNRHMRTHTGERPFCCDVCKKAFPVKDTLNNHMRTHTGERPFHCDVCERSFGVKKSLILHLRTHTGERPFLCNVCKRSFTVKSSLDRHMRIHTS